MGAYLPEEEPPVLPNHGDLQWQCPTGLLCISLVLLLFLVPAGWYGYYDDQSRIPPEYSIVITAISGLNPAATDPQQSGQWLLSPVFNITVSVASHSRVYGVCIGPRTAVEVSYSYIRLPLASGSAPGICVGPRESSGPRPVVARGRGVAVPGFLIDSLAEEMRSGKAIFEVKLMEGPGDGWWDVATTWIMV